MATAKKAENAGANQTPASNVVEEPGLNKFTWNVRGATESLTIRCDTEDELKILRDRWKPVITPPRRKLAYMHGGDKCLVENCGGSMVTRTGTNRKTQQPYQFLRCSNHPKCQFTAYIENEANTPEEENGGNGEPATIAATSAAA